MKSFLYLPFLSMFLFSNNAPYSQQKFQSVLDKAKLQAPLSKYDPKYSVKYGQFKNYYNKFFYLKDNNMVFFMCKNHHRSELRFKDEWQVSTKTPKILEVKVKILPLTEKKEFTFLQIHPNGNVYPYMNKPLLRIVWYKNLRHRKNHIWAVIKNTNNANDKKYLKIDLGKNPKQFFNVKIEVKNSKLNIWLNNIKKINNFDLEYWDGYRNYFKLGVYLQDNGCAKTMFNQIKIKG